MRHGATAAAWSHWAYELGLAEDLLPVVSNPAAKISDRSHLTVLGKTPSIYLPDGTVAGIAGWTKKKSAPADISRWGKNGDYGICLQARLARALDIDIEGPSAADIEARIRAQVAGIPVRRRGGTRKILLPFILRGNYQKRKITTKEGIIEFLAHGQQFVVEGTHPSGNRYYWEPEFPTLPEITPEQFEALWQELVDTWGISESREKDRAISSAWQSDPVAKYLIDNGLVVSTRPDGMMMVRCPWEHEHTTDTGPTATVYWPAHTGGYAKGHFNCKHAHCQHRTTADFLEAIGYTILGLDDLGPAQDTETANDDKGAQEKSSLYRVHKLAELLDAPPIEYHIKGVLPKCEVAMIYGASGSGKSFVALDMAMSVASGVPWRERRVKKGRVIYLVAEGAAGFGYRLKAYLASLGPERGDHDAANIGFIVHAADLLNTEHLKQLILEIGRADLLIIDTLAQCTPGIDENSSEGMSRLLQHAKALHRHTGATILFVHHAGKDLARGARGWSGLRAAVDAEIMVKRVDDSVRMAKVTKAKDGADGAEYYFRLAPVAVGVDSDGDVITSCVCLPAAEPGSETEDGQKESHQAA